MVVEVLVRLEEEVVEGWWWRQQDGDGGSRDGSAGDGDDDDNNENITTANLYLVFTYAGTIITVFQLEKPLQLTLWEESCVTQEMKECVQIPHLGSRVVLQQVMVHFITL